jgi:outer membrane protein assembly factor BamB
MSTQLYDDARLARLAADWMTQDVAGAAADDHLDQILSATGRMRPLPRWLALLKEPSMRTKTMTRVAVGSPARRPILVLATIALLILALVVATIGAQVLFPPRPAAADDWPMFRGDSTRTGLGITGPVGNPVIAWRRELDAPVTRNLAIVGDYVYALSDDGKLHSLALGSGADRWVVDAGVADIGSGPAVLDSTVYIIDAGGHVRALDAATGGSRWTSATAAVDPSLPAFDSAHIFVGTGGGELVAFDRATGAERWRKRVSTLGRVNSPATDGTSVFVGTEGSFVAFDAATGTERWRIDTGTDLTATAVAAAGIAYIGASPDTTAGSLRAVDAATGEIRWTLSGPWSSPTVSDGVGYVSTGGGEVAAIDTADGSLLWRRAFAGRVRPPAVAGGVLYVPADTERRVYALDAATGGELSQVDLDGGVQCCIAVAKGSVWVGTVIGSVYRISGDGAALLPAPLPSVAVTVAPTVVPTASTSAPAPELASFVWRSSGQGQGWTPPAGLTLDTQGNIWAPDAPNSRFAIFERDGTFLEYWGEKGAGDGRFDLQRENGDGYGSVAFAPDGTFYVLDAGNRRVVKFDADRRFVLTWGGFGDGPGNYRDPMGIAVDREGFVWVADAIRGHAEKYDPEGNVVATIDVFSNTTPGFNQGNGLALDADGNLYISQSNPNQIAKFSPQGELLATFGESGPRVFATEYPGQVAVDAEGRVFVTLGPGRGELPGVAVFAADGTYLGGFGPLGFDDGFLSFPIGVALDAEGNVYVLDFGGSSLDDSQSGEVQQWRLMPPLAP